MSESRGLGSVEDTGLGQRILRLFHAPRRTFEAVADGGNWPDWVAPVALVALFWAAHNLAALPVVAPEVPASQPGWEQLTQEQRELAEKGLEVWRSHGWFSLPLISSFSSLALVALVLVGVVRWILRGDTNLRQMLAVKSYASLVAIPQWILLTPLVRAGNASSSPQSFSLGALLPTEAANSMFGQFLTGLSAFDLWQVWVVGVGLGVMTGVPTRRAVASVLVLWLAWVALGVLAQAVAPQTPVPSQP